MQKILKKKKKTIAKYKILFINYKKFFTLKNKSKIFAFKKFFDIILMFYFLKKFYDSTNFNRF